MKKSIVLALLFLAACTQTQTAPQTTPAPKSEFKNLQVFPKDIPRPQLIAAMRGFTRGLGVRCDFCHVQTATEPKPQFDFPADTKEQKRVARVMIQMAMQINGTWIPRAQAAENHPAEVAATEEAVRVSCWTCHRGKEEPEAPPPPPAEGPH